MAVEEEQAETVTSNYTGHDDAPGPLGVYISNGPGVCYNDDRDLCL